MVKRAGVWVFGHCDIMLFRFELSFVIRSVKVGTGRPGYDRPMAEPRTETVAKVHKFPAK